MTRYTPFNERFGCIPLITVQVADIEDETAFPEFAIARAYSRGETPSDDLLARANRIVDQCREDRGGSHG